MTNKVHWDRISQELRVFGMGNEFQIFALWPEPVDHDACLAKAGFSAFADLGRDDPDLREIAERLIKSLAVFGEPCLRSADPMVYSTGWLESLLVLCRLRPRPPAPTLIDYALAAAEDDQFKTSVIDFGKPAQATLMTADGHPIFWVGLPNSGVNRIEEIFAQISQGRPIAQTTLNWKILMPDKTAQLGARR